MRSEVREGMRTRDRQRSVKDEGREGGRDRGIVVGFGTAGRMG